MNVVIIGATSGIGRQIAIDFAQRGWKVGAAGRRLNLLKSLKAENEGIIEIEEIDITKEDSINHLSDLVDRLGGMDLFFNVSGVGSQNPQLNFEIEEHTLNTNVIGFTRMITWAYNYFKAHGGNGQIAVVSSIAGTKGLGMAASYSASKRYQNMYINSLDQLAHIQKLNITFTDIRPGFVRTDLLKDGRNYPMLLEVNKVAKLIVKATLKRKRIYIVDWRYRIMVAFWGLLPEIIWRRLSIKNE